MNLLLLWTDEQRADTLSAYGNPWGICPNLDRFARESTVFANAYCTSPVCTPSRGSILTGRWPHHHGAIFNNIPLHADSRTIPEMVRGEYATRYIGKWHLGDEVFAQHGWQEWLNVDDSYLRYYGPGRDRATRSDFHHFLISRGYKPDCNSPHGPFFGRELIAGLPERHSKPRWQADRCIDFVRTHTGRNWICSLNLLEPHMPFTGPRNGMYDPSELPVDPDWLAANPTDGLLRTRIIERTKAVNGSSGFRIDNEGMRRCKANYWGMCSHVDHHLGRVLNALADSGQWDDTLIVFTSDHGDQMGGHRLLGKSVAYEPSTRVPLLVKLPGQRESRHIETPVSQIDLAPTILAGLGETPPADLDGYSRIDDCRGEAPAKRDVIIVWNRDDGHDSDNGLHAPAEVYADLGQHEDLQRHVCGRHRVLVSPDRWKLVAGEFGERELYDLTADPWELRNLAHDASHATRRRDLESRLHAWQATARDDCPLG